MSNLKKLKTHDRQVIAQNLMTALKKRYKSAVPKHSLALLETLLFAAVIENVHHDDGEEAYERLINSFHDMNEIRVSSISEIEAAMSPVHEASWKALRIRDLLQQVFEKFYRFDLEEYKRKPVEQLEKLMAKWKFTTPFMKHYLYQHALGAHSIALDDKSRDALAFLGVVEPAATIDQASEDLKQVIRKADAAHFCHLVRCLACDAQFKGKLKLTPGQAQGEGPDPTTAVQRLNEVLSGQTPKAPPSVKTKAEPAKAEPVKKSPPAKVEPVKAAPKPTKPAVAHTTTVKKPPEKKSTPVRTTATAKKPVTKKVSKPAPATKAARKK